MLLELPDPRETLDIEMDDGAVIRARRHGAAEAPVRLYLSHGNGFAIDGYLPFWGALADRYDLVLFDMRNHGRNPLSDPANHTYAQMARDIGRLRAEADAWLGGKPSVGVFHSMSARVAMKHAVETGWVWDALALYDPPNVPLKGHPLYETMCAFEHRLVALATNRPDRFADPSELAAVFARTRAFAGWVAGAHDLMARATLRREAEAGDWVLACPRALEAAIYEQALTLDLWPKPSDFGGPVLLVGADPDLTVGPPNGKANKALAGENGYAYEAIPGAGHMLQIEKPAACIRALETFLDGCGLGAQFMEMR